MTITYTLMPNIIVRINILRMKYSLPTDKRIIYQIKFFLGFDKSPGEYQHVQPNNRDTIGRQKAENDF